MLVPLRRWANETGDAWVLGVVRALLGAMLFLRALEEAQEFLAYGYFGDNFHLPLVPETWVPSRSGYLVILAARILFAVLVTVGHSSRMALAGSALLGAYMLLCDRLGFHHDRYALCCYALLLALTPCNRALTIAKDVPADGAPLWGMRLAQLQVALIYLTSGGSKLLDPDWRDGLVLADRFEILRE